MEKSFFDQMGGTYYQQGDYLLPDLAVSESVPIGIWGQRQQEYLREHRNSIYTALFLNGNLDSHLAEIDQQAEEMFSQLVKQIADCEEITEDLKEYNHLEWVRKMNNIQNRVAEIINTDLIYT